MRKDKRTTEQRQKDGKRQWKEHIKSSLRKKTTKSKREEKNKKKAAEELAFQRHITRLKGEMGL